MTKKTAKKTTSKASNASGSKAPLILTIVLLIIGGVIVAGYFSKGSEDESVKVSENASAVEVEGTETASGEPEDPFPDSPIKPGNPIVATIQGEEITRQDVFAFIQNLPPQSRQGSIDVLFPAALDQLINARLIEDKAESANMGNDPEVQKQVAEARKRIEQTVYIQNLVSGKITDDKIKSEYDKMVAQMPKGQMEVKAAHILVEDKETAEKIIKDLQGNGDFAELAKEYSKDSTAQNGGELGYFLKTDVVPEFGEKAFSMEPGTYTQDPVQTEFGYHVIRVEDKRERAAPSFEQTKPFIEAELRRRTLTEAVEGWREQTEIVVYDINGEPVEVPSEEPSAGQP